MSLILLMVKILSVDKVEISFDKDISTYFINPNLLNRFQPNQIEGNPLRVGIGMNIPHNC